MEVQVGRSYAEKLRDPRWQKMRLEVLEAANFTCRECESKTDTLHVHHPYYERGKNPWEYPSQDLWVLCESCHTRRADMELTIQKCLAGFTTPELSAIWGSVILTCDNRGALKMETICDHLLLSDVAFNSVLENATNHAKAEALSLMLTKREAVVA